MPADRRGSGPGRLGAIVLARGRGAFALRLVESLARECAGLPPELRLELQPALLDAREDEGDATWWRSLAGMGASVLPVAHLSGDSARVAHALASSPGADDEPVLLLAPDTAFPPGSLAPLLEAWTSARRPGLVAPRAYLDETLQIALPAAPPPGARERALGRLGRAAPAFAPLHQAARLARLRPCWSREPRLAFAGFGGGCLLTRRASLAAACAAAGPAAGLSALEARLVRLLRRDGRALSIAAESRVLHHGSRWSGLGAAAPDRALRDRLFLLAGAAPPALRRSGWIDLGAPEEPPVLALARLAHFWIELAPESAPQRAGGVLGAGASCALTHRAWSWLPPGVYLARALDRQSGAPLGRWRFEKRGPARSWPLDPLALAELGPHPPRGAGRRARGL